MRGSDQMEMMELEDLLSDLHALKKLYGLLHATTTPKTTDVPQCSPSQVLDDKSKLLLKRLLDGATEQAFQSHAKIIAEKCTASSTDHIFSSTQPPEASSTHQLPSKLHDSSAMTVTSPKTNQSNTLPAISNCSSSKYQLLNSDSMNSRSKKRCKICGRSTIKRSDSTKYNDIAVTSIENTLQDSNKKSESVDGYTRESSESKEKIKENDHIVDTHEQFDFQMKNPAQKTQKSLHDRTETDETELTQSIQKEKNKLLQPNDQKKSLQDQIQPDKIDSTQSTAKKEKNKLLLTDVDQNSVVSNAGKEKKGAATTQILNLTRETDQFPTRLTSQNDGKSEMTSSPGRVPIQTGKVVRAGNELTLSDAGQKDGRGRKLKPKPSSTHDSDSVSVTASQILPPKMPQSRGKKIGASPPVLPVQTKSMRHTPRRFDSMNQGSRIKREPTAQIARNRSTNKISGGSRRGAKMEKTEPHRTVILPTLLDHPPSGSNTKIIQKDCTAQNQQRIKNFNKVQEGPPKRSPPCNLIREESSTSTSTSPSWTSKEYSSGSEVNSMPHRMMTQQHYIKPTLHRESSHVSHRKGKRRSQSLTRRSLRRQVDTYPTVHRAGPMQIGRLRRFKNKLGLIFYHHHHHHHHHHANDEDHHDSSDGDQTGHHSTLTSRTNQDRSLWKYMRKIIHHKNKDADVDRRVVGGTRRGAHQQQGHLHALVDGLLRHVWHSKKSRPIDGVGKSNKKRKVVKKWHWWQRFYKRSGRRSSNKVVRGRAGFSARKHQLPAAHKRP